MSDPDNISGLETALAERAKKLADEHLAGGRAARERILEETRQRLHIDEEREVLAAKAQAERSYRQRVQAAELELRAGLDRMRWELVDAVLARLPARLEEQVSDVPCYHPLMLAFLREGAQAIERDELIVRLGKRDWDRFHRDWDSLARQAAPAKRLTLSPETLDSIGGVLVASTDGRIRFDNTFEGRMERMDETLRGAIAERLEPRAVEMPHG